MYFLGINDGHLATAALLKNGKIIACVSEERFTGVKNQAGLPIQSIKFCLDWAKISPEEIGLITFGGKTTPPTTQKIESKSSVYDHTYSMAKPLLTAFRYASAEIQPLWRVEETIYPVALGLLSPFAQKQRLKGLLSHFDFEPKKIKFLDHHLAHAHAVLWASGFVNKYRNILVLTCDGEGDGLSATVNIYKNGKLNTISKTSMTNSLGNFYRSVTKYLGMKPLEHEYKVMGLAAYVDDKKADQLYNKIKNLITVDKNNLQIKTAVNSQLFKLGYLDKILSEYRFDYIAYAAQKLTEKVLTDWISTAVKKTGIKNILLSGGVFMNVKANQKISELSGVRNLFVMPSGGDESNAIGAAYWGYYTKSQKAPLPLDDLYLGPEYKIDTKLLRNAGWKTTKPKDLEKKVAQLLSHGEIVARFAGRMEWGARALGNRSILADASRLEVVAVINKMIKNRDFWMPFAPAILKRYHKKYVLNTKNVKAPYMIITFDTTQRGKKDLAAAVHQYDKSARPQIVDQKTNPDYYQILDEFRKITGKYGFLNTSFNLHGFPIVASPKDALHVFTNSDLKYLAIGSYLVEKKE